MPCRSDGWETEPVVPNFGPVLCGILTALENAGAEDLDSVLSRVNWSEVGQKREVVEAWWVRHKTEDLKRRAAEAEKERKQLERDRREYERLKKKFEGK